jgi:hypothetical protein
MFMVGWGEGLEQVAGWLDKQPDITGVVTVTTMKEGLQEYLRPGAQAAGSSTGAMPRDAGYVVIYNQDVQMGPLGPPFDQFYGHATPLYSVSIHGVPYAWVYPVPPAATHLSARFGSDIQLYGFKQDTLAVRDQTLTFTLVWAPATRLPAGVILFAHLIGPDGTHVIQVDPPYAPAAWRPGVYTRSTVPLNLPSTLAPGTYRLVIGLYDWATTERLPLMTTQVVEPGLDGADALLVTAVQVK